MARKETGRDYELIVKAIYEALLKQENVKNLDIKHNTTIKGNSTSHQIDVYWKFRAGDLDYETIVQVKKKKNRVSQGDILLFSKVVDDIPGKPTGVFITRSGFQKGALNCARFAGIKLLQLSDVVNSPPTSPITLTFLSFAHMEIVPEKLAMRTTVYTTTLRDINVVLDRRWAKEYAPTLLESMLTPTQGRFLCGEASIIFVNDVEEDRGTLADRVRAFAQASMSSGDLRIDFPEPTFMLGHRFTDSSLSSIDRIKVLRIDVSVDVARTVRWRHFSAENFTTYLLRNILEPDERYLLVGGGESEPQAIVALRK